MSDIDKVLINAYLDNELSESEIQQVQKLISESAEAKAYFESLKSVNLELKALAEDEIQQAMHQRTRAFIASKIKPKLSKDSTSIFAFLQTRLFQNIAGYSVTAGLFFSIGANLMEQPKALSLDDFNVSDTLTKEYPKFRNESFDTEKNKLEDTLKEMVTSKVLNSRLIWGGDTYFITIEELVLSKDNAECFQGHFLNEGMRQEFLYCISENDATLTYIN